MIPDTFAERYFWPFGDTTPPSPPADACPVTPNSEEGAGATFRFPAGVFSEVNSLISFAFTSVEKQLHSDTSFLDASLDNKAVIVSCTQTQGAQIIDAALKEVARKQAADVLVIDALEFARGRFGALGKGAEVIDKLYTSVQRIPNMESTGKDGDIDPEPVVALSEDVCQFVNAILATSLPGRMAEPTRRIIYMRNFHTISSTAKPLMTYLLQSLFTSPGPGTYPPEPYPQHVTKRADVVVFGVSSSNDTLETGAHPSSIPKESLFLSTLFNNVRNSSSYSYGALRSESQFLSSFFCTMRGGGPFFHPDMSCLGILSESERLTDTVRLEPIPFNVDLGKKVDELTAGALKVSIFARNVKMGAEDEDWQKKAKAEHVKLTNRTLLCACLERAGGQSEEDSNEIAAWDDAPSNTLLSVQQASNLIHTTLGLMETALSPDETPKSFKNCLQESYKACEQRKKEREDWVKGIGSTEPDSDSDSDSDSKEEEESTEKPKDDPSIDDLTRGVSFHARELKGCIVDIESIQTTFSDVFVDPAIVESLQTIVSLPLLYPSYFKTGVLAKEAIGGVLLYGPPGTGKTMLCRALAKTSKARMIHIKPSDINDKYVGESEKKIAAVFELAYKLAPCIVFVDELDALFNKRNDCTKSWERNILTEFMQSMDGLQSAQKNRDSNIVIVGATNRPYDLDLAILRRMPRRILVDMPNLQMRKGILASYLEEEVLDEGVSTDRLAIDTEGLSGSDLKNLCVAAALASVKEAIGPRWKEYLSPPTPPKTPSCDDDEEGEKQGEKKGDSEHENGENPKQGDIAEQEGEKDPELPVRKITSANIRQARLEIVKSNAGSGLDELYKWHRAHTTTLVPERKTTAVAGIDTDLRFPLSRFNMNKGY